MPLSCAPHGERECSALSSSVASPVLFFGSAFDLIQAVMWEMEIWITEL
jgi:hypothetical protein